MSSEAAACVRDMISRHNFEARFGYLRPAPPAKGEERTKCKACDQELTPGRIEFCTPCALARDEGKRRCKFCQLPLKASNVFVFCGQCAGSQEEIARIMPAAAKKAGYQPKTPRKPKRSTNPADFETSVNGADFEIGVDGSLRVARRTRSRSNEPNGPGLDYAEGSTLDTLLAAFGYRARTEGEPDDEYRRAFRRSHGGCGECGEKMRSSWPHSICQKCQNKTADPVKKVTFDDILREYARDVKERK